MSDAIWTLDARDFTLLDVLARAFRPSAEQVRAAILGARETTVELLRAKGVSYENLRNGLVPQRDRREIGLIFDRASIQSGMYGYAVAERLIPLLPRDLISGLLTGDLIIHDQDLGFDLLRAHVIPPRHWDGADTAKFFCVYINNLSQAMVAHIVSSLRDWRPYVGYVDASTGSRMKDWLSFTLGMSYLKARRLVLNGHEEDAGDDEDYNMLAWPWERNGYPCRSIRDSYFRPLLTYKIERRVLRGFDSDTRFALTAISGRPLDLETLPVAVGRAKSEYLRRQHGASLERAGIDHLTDAELADLIRAKISGSYIYELRYLADTQQSLFTVMLEVRYSTNPQVVTRLLASLEYQPEVPGLRLVTLY